MLFVLWDIYVCMNITDLIMLNYPQILRKIKPQLSQVIFSIYLQLQLLVVVMSENSPTHNYEQN